MHVDKELSPFQSRIRERSKELLLTSGLSGKVFYVPCYSSLMPMWRSRALGYWMCDDHGVWRNVTTSCLKRYFRSLGISNQRHKEYNTLSDVEMLLMIIDDNISVDMTRDVFMKLTSPSPIKCHLSEIQYWCSKEFIEEQRMLEDFEQEFGKL